MSLFIRIHPADDVVIAKQGTASAAPGDTVLYTITVQNLGPADAAGVRMTDGPFIESKEQIGGFTKGGAWRLTSDY